MERFVYFFCMVQIKKTTPTNPISFPLTGRVAWDRKLNAVVRVARPIAGSGLRTGTGDGTGGRIPPLRIVRCSGFHFSAAFGRWPAAAARSGAVRRSGRVSVFLIPSNRVGVRAETLVGGSAATVRAGGCAGLGGSKKSPPGGVPFPRQVLGGRYEGSVRRTAVQRTPQRTGPQGDAP